MEKERPDHHDADLTIKFYELRREPVMREARAAINSQFWPKSFDEVAAVAKTDHPLNSAFRQTSTYWEMVYGTARHGITHPDYLIESNGEGLYLFARMRPFLEEYRKTHNPRAFQNAEWIATHCEGGKSVFDFFAARVAKVMATR